LKIEVNRRKLFDARRSQGEHLAEVRVPDERDVAELIVERQAFACLFWRENVFEFLEAHRRAMTELHTDFVESDLVR
jgi:hypothetical protein